MNELLLAGLIFLGSFPFAYLILKLIFKKSIMFTFVILIVVFIYIVSFSYFYSGYTGIKTLIWVLPGNFAIGVGIFAYINKILSVPLNKSIIQVKELSEGNLKVEIKESESENELGILNNSLLKLISNLSSIISETITSSDNLAGASPMSFS